MATTIVTKSGSGAPTASDLVAGELAVDLTNKRLYTEDSGGTVLELGTNPSGDVTFGDNGKAIFGAGSDLQIYHDGSHSYIKDAGTGQLRLLAGTNVQIWNADATNLAANFNGDTQTSLYYAGSSKLSTSASGIDVTGSVTADGLEVATSAADTGVDLTLNGNKSTNGGVGSIIFENAGDSVGMIRSSRASANDAADMLFYTQAAGGANSKRQTIASNGDISFYEDTGTTPKFFWDASAENLGLGTTAPDRAIKIEKDNAYVWVADAAGGNVGFIGGSGQNDGLMRLYEGTGHTAKVEIHSNSDSYFNGGNVGIGGSPDTTLTVFGGGVAEFRVGNIGPSSNSAIRVSRNDTSVTGGNPLGYLEFGGNDSTSNVDAAFAYVGAEASGAHAAGDNPTELIFGVTADNTSAPVERMRLDASGNLLVGKTASDSTTVGTQIEASGAIAVTRDGSTPLYLNRKTSDGTIADFRKDGTTVGSIGTYSGDLWIGQGNTGLLFNDGGDVLRPANASGGNRNGNYDLGASDSRFKDLYLSGDLITGGGGTSNTGEIQFVADSTRARIVGGYDSGGGGYLSFRTDTTGGSDIERVVIGNDGVLEAKYGVYLGGTAAANKLEDYETGTFTPVISGTSVTGAGTYTIQSGKYVIVGKMVYVSVRLGWTAHTGSGNMIIASLPTTANVEYANLGVVFRDGLTVSSGHTVNVGVVPSTNHANILEISTGTDNASVIALDTAVSDLAVSGWYQIA